MRSYAVAHLTDHHFGGGMKDQKALDLSIQALKILRPDEVVLGGDLLDVYSLSRFPKKADKLFSLQEEIDHAYNYLVDVVNACPGVTVHLLEGNHEQRVQKYIERQAQGFGTLECLRVPELLALKDLDIKYWDAGHGPKIGGIQFIHGSLIRKFAGMSAKAMAESYGCSIAMGHSHRLGCILHTMGDRTIACYESACLCLLHPEYVTHKPDWQQGLSAFLFTGKRKEAHTWIPVNFSQKDPLSVLRCLKR